MVDGFWLSGGWQNVPVSGDGDIQELLGHNIKYVLDVQFTPTDGDFTKEYLMKTLREFGIEYASRPLYDGDFGQDMKDFWKDTNAVINSFIELAQAREQILIKCAAGMSRSPSALMAYLCSSKGISYEEAQKLLDTADRTRADAMNSISPFFRAQLKRIYGSSNISIGA